MFVAKIKCEDRTEKQMIIWSSKKGKFTFESKSYVIDWDCVYRGKYFGFSCFMSDWIKGNEKPLDYSDNELKVSADAKDPDKIGTMIARIDMSPNFERNIFMLVAVNIIVTIFIAFSMVRGAA